MQNIDKIGIICSAACAIHCLAVPLIVFLSPTITAHLENEWIHLGLLTFLIPIALFAFIRTKKIHNETTPLLIGVVGVTFLLSAVAFEIIADAHVHGVEATLTTLGSLTLITAHLKNATAYKLKP